MSVYEDDDDRLGEDEPFGVCEECGLDGELSDGVCEECWDGMTLDETEDMGPWDDDEDGDEWEDETEDVLAEDEDGWAEVSF